LKTNNNVI